MARIGRLPGVPCSDTPDRMDASVTNLGFRGGLEAYPSLQRY